MSSYHTLGFPRRRAYDYAAPKPILTPAWFVTAPEILQQIGSFSHNLMIKQWVPASHCQQGEQIKKVHRFFGLHGFLGHV
jgi:hypothetical protein